MARGAGSEVWMIAPVKNFGRVRLSTIFLQNKYAGECRRGGTMSFCSVLSFPRPNIKKRLSRTFLMEFLDIRRRDVWTVHGWLHLSWFGISASSIIYKLREFSSNQPSLHLWYFSTYTGIKNSLLYPYHMLRAHYISMSLATVVWECSLNQFSTALFVSLFVNREPQQIFMGENTEYRASLLKGRVNFPVSLLHIYWVCQYKVFLFLISEGWWVLLNLHWNIIGVIIHKFPTAILYLVVLY